VLKQKRLEAVFKRYMFLKNDQSPFEAVGFTNGLLKQNTKFWMSLSRFSNDQRPVRISRRDFPQGISHTLWQSNIQCSQEKLWKPWPLWMI
jgi:hypothetical protein